MVKGKYLPKDEVLLQHPILVFVFLVLGFIVMDPFELSPVGGHDFRPVKNDIASYEEVMGNWPKDNHSRLARGDKVFVDEVFGPESLEFDIHGRGPYAGLADGRIVRWMGQDGGGWETSNEICAKGVNSTTYKQWKFEKQCGRPLGLRFDKSSGDLYIADAYFGVLVVGPKGGYATPLATNVAGKPILFANDLDIHHNGSVFFTDSSKRYDRVNHFFIMLEGEATGRLLRYDPPTKTTHVVLMKYWLEGPKNGTSEIMANLPGFPDNVRINEKGEFWVAIDCCRTRAQEVLINNPWMRSVYFRLPVHMRYLAKWVGMKMYSVVSRFNEKGEILDVLEDRKGAVMKLVSEVREEKGKLWIGTVAHNHIATLALESLL
uniref:Strictosidine synthase conserved region domain-containing protein n=1 Tax=Daucus carota subsp. sativus TaxID=79200 RepID=A0A175YLC6_DAUCS